MRMTAPGDILAIAQDLLVYHQSKATWVKPIESGPIGGRYTIPELEGWLVKALFEERPNDDTVSRIIREKGATNYMLYEDIKGWVLILAWKQQHSHSYEPF